MHKDEKETILVVEDSKMHAQLLSRLLQDYEYNVIVASNGIVALKILNESQVDLIISDIEMPEMNGFELCKKIKEEKWQKIPIILMTSLSDPENIMHSLNCKADHYITKPYEAELLISRVKELLSQKLYINNDEPVGVNFAGRQYTIYSDRQHILNMLMCTYENAAWENRQLLQTQLQLSSTNKLLAERNEEIRLLNKNLLATIDELEQTRNELIQSEKMASLGRLVTGFAHEINTPIGISLTAVSTLAEIAKNIERMLEQEEVNEEQLEKNLHKIYPASELALNNIVRAAKLVESFRITSIEQNIEDKKLFCLFDIIENVVLSLSSKFCNTKIKIENKCPEKINLYGYPGIISQILINLMTNSLIHAFDDGQLKGKISFMAEKKKEQLVLTYKDTGRGMSEEIVTKIFEPFFTTKRNQGGTGLGMYICYNLVVNRLKGSLICQSIPLKGTSFIITLPLQEMEPSTSEASS